jgi:hypothetical protein
LPGNVVLITNSIDQPQRGDPINNAECFLEDARKSFCLAANATGQEEVERYAALGREYLMLAHRAATVDTVPQSPSFWDLPK